MQKGLGYGSQKYGHGFKPWGHKPRSDPDPYNSKISG